MGWLNGLIVVLLEAWLIAEFFCLTFQNRVICDSAS